MSRTSTHYDPYYSPSSPVGRVRAERTKYLLGFLGEPASPWDAAESLDPSRETVVAPAHEVEAARLLLDYYEAVRRDRRVQLAATLGSFFGVGGLLVLIGWMSGNALIALGGAGAGVFGAYGLLTGIITLPGKAGAAKGALKMSEYFRDRGVLDGYLITARSAEVIWEAAGLEARRRTLDYEVERLRSHPHLPEHRQDEILRLQGQEQELRRTIVDMLDPQTQTPAQPSRVSLGRLSPESTKMLWGDEDGETR